MGILKTTRKVTEEEKAFQLENLKRLESDFDATKAMGVKKYSDAMQFIYDKKRRCFVVVKGPEETFKVKNPYIIDFDQVKDAYVEVEEFWTEGPRKFELKAPQQYTLKMGDFDKVFWRYNIYMNFKTTHPYAEHIRYQMNYNTIVTRVSGLRIMAKRGLELNGEFRGNEIKKQAERVAEFAEHQQKAVGKEKMLELVTHTRPDSMLERMAEDFFEQKFVDRMNNISKHLDRAYRICEVLEK
ncbi:MAG: hypothetical protein Q4D99_03575 [Bacillota bacterium]|nr:hypothetical protein [Bacillota bacterium]